MKLTSAAVLAMAAALTLVGCAETVPPEPDLPRLPAINATVGLFGQCNFTTAQSLARSYFRAGSSERMAATDNIRGMQFAGAGTPTANTNGFAVFKLIAFVRDNSLEAGTPQNGADLTIALINCMDVVATETNPTIRDLLIGALDYGAYAVRGENNVAEPPVISEDGRGGSRPLDGNFFAWAGGRALYYSARVNPSFLEEVVEQGVSAHRWGIVHDASTPGPQRGPGFDDAIIVAICAAVQDQAFFRIGRNHSGDQSVLQSVAFPWTRGPCAPQQMQAPTGLVPRFVQGLLSLFAPKPLMAGMLIPGGTGGLGDGYTDFAIVDAGAVFLEFTTQPTNGTIKAAFPVQVRATATNGTPLEHVAITLIVDGNQGDPVSLTGTSDPLCTNVQNVSVCRFTQEDGKATFSVSLNKAGGYRLRATSDFTGFPAVFIISNLFNLQQN